ncbi:response regulator transcription factor [Streptosporangiaceae bacterium NEAU-GS5]|nr:response regulator transcription factor [Streptosporangiaceae bacterium NEAU-GS5]
MTVRLVIADDQAMIRTGLRLMIATQPDLEVVAEAADGREAVDLVRRERPDIVLLDIAMPHLDGVAAAREILASAAPTPGVIMLTTFDTDENLDAALAAGVSGFLLKTSPPEQLFAAIHTVARGEAMLDPAVTSRVIARYASPRAQAAAIPPELTPRELDVLRLVARGLSNAEIGKTLFIGEATVSTHINRLFAKLGLRHRAQLVRYAYESGIVHVGTD